MVLEAHQGVECRESAGDRTRNERDIELIVDDNVEVNGEGRGKHPER
jgi:hypothetical protein